MTSRTRRLFPVFLALSPLALMAMLEIGARCVVPESSAASLQHVHALAHEALYDGGSIMMRPHARVDMRAFQGGCHGEVTTNALGMRGPEVAAEKRGLRVACLGDSVTFGWCVDESESYPRRLEALLSRKLGGPVEALNFGFPGMTSNKGVQVSQVLAPRSRPTWW
ncbi:MAG: SGNH/GDSL hydrolase family protein [Acidobacteriota bacterium]